MGNIVTIASSKGGVGKTVLAACLATNLAARGYHVAVVDADPNASLADWYSVYSGPAITCMTESGHVEVVDVAQREADRRDVTLVDTAGFGSLTASAAIAAADHVLIPVMADRGSVREAIRTARQVESLARAARRAIPIGSCRRNGPPMGLQRVRRWTACVPSACRSRCASCRRWRPSERHHLLEPVCPVAESAGNVTH